MEWKEVGVAHDQCRIAALDTAGLFQKGKRMALIRSLEPGKGNARAPQSEVDGTYVVVDDPVACPP